jgi:hypothetical protein
MTAARDTRSRLARSIAPDPVHRDPDDYYVTPRKAIDSLLDAEPIRGPVWEPACGNGAISLALMARSIEVHSTDIADHGYGASGLDFLFCARPRFSFKTMLTNPPFKLAQQFVQRALLLDCEKVIVLERLSWLESQRRRRFFENSPFARIWIHSSRQNVSRRGQDYGHNGMICFAWFVFERGYGGQPTIGWLP